MAFIMHNPTMSLGVFEDPCCHGYEPCFGMGLHPSDFESGHVMARQHSLPHSLTTGYNRPWDLAHEEAHELAKKLHSGMDGFQACVDVHHFKPNEITVKTVDNTVVVEAKHEERDDGHGGVIRNFIRKYLLPKGFDLSSIHSTLSSDGVLIVKAPPPKKIVQGNLIHVLIHQSGPEYLTLKENQPHEEGKENGDKKK